MYKEYVDKACQQFKALLEEQLQVLKANDILFK